MRPTDIIHNSWNPILYNLYQPLLSDLNEAILPFISYQPKKENIFRVFKMPLKDIRVVILGQDPFPTPGDAIGLSFMNGTDKIPVSLRNIYKEIKDSTGRDADIKTWESQNIFLLNTALTVKTGEPGSHIIYWSKFTADVIKLISEQNPVIWILWGKYAQRYKSYIKDPFVIKNYPDELLSELPIKDDCNYVLEAPHPASEVYSGGKAGFYGCNHFNMVNTILKAKGQNMIEW